MKVLLCSTWNILIVFFMIISLGCKKDDPNPELKDKIYLDLVNQEALELKKIEDSAAKIQEILKSLEKSKPQTGDIKRNNIKLHDFEKIKMKQQQQLKMWRILKFERLQYVRKKRLALGEDSWNKTSELEFEKYHAEKKLTRSKPYWDIKDRFKESGYKFDPSLLGEGIKTGEKK